MFTSNSKQTNVACSTRWQRRQKTHIRLQNKGWGQSDQNKIPQQRRRSKTDLALAIKSLQRWFIERATLRLALQIFCVPPNSVRFLGLDRPDKLSFTCMLICYLMVSPKFNPPLQVCFRFRSSHQIGSTHTSIPQKQNGLARRESSVAATRPIEHTEL